jgi:hypothetical protein
MNAGCIVEIEQRPFVPRELVFGGHPLDENPSAERVEREQPAVAVP